METAALEGCSVLKPGMDGVQEFTHNGTDGLELLEATGLDQVVISPDVRIVACGAESGHIECDPQVAVAGLGPARFFVDARAGLALAWIESGHSNPLFSLHVVGQDQEFTEELDGVGGGDAFNVDQEVEDRVEVLVGGDEVAGLLAQVLDLSLEVGDSRLEIGQDKLRGGGGELCCMELILGLGSELVEGGDAAGTEHWARIRARCPWAVFLNSRGFPICPSRLIATVTVLCLTSIPVVIMLWFSNGIKSVRLMTGFPDPEPAQTDLVSAGSRALLTASEFD